MTLDLTDNTLTVNGKTYNNIPTLLLLVIVEMIRDRDGLLTTCTDDGQYTPLNYEYTNSVTDMLVAQLTEELV